MFTLAETAHDLAVSPSTLQWWTTERLVTRLDDRGRRPSIPFIGLAEAVVLSAFRRSGVPLQRIRPALRALQKEIGLEHALASRSLFTDGAEILYDYAERHPDVDELSDLVVVRSGQRVFVPVVKEYLQRIKYDAGWPVVVRLPRYESAAVIVDPRRAFGQPIFERGGSRIEDVIDRWRAGDSVPDLSREFGVPAPEIEEVLRAA
jgi:uncharacterized protein (DUF433 family)/DNA-binding transcriptional MerR regulator